MGYHAVVIGEYAERQAASRRLMTYAIAAAIGVFLILGRRCRRRLRGALERLSPILMTALATGLSLVPLVAAGAIPGHEIEHPMAMVILGGLITSTMLNLFVVRSIYLRFAFKLMKMLGQPHESTIGTTIGGILKNIRY